MRSYRFLPLFFAFFSCSPPLRAQSGDLVQRYTTDNGLPSNGIKGLEWDETTGFLWIATEAGVTRYNGADLRTWSRSNTPDLASERMLLMQKNRAGRIYTVDETGHVFFVMQNSLQFLLHVNLDTRASTARLIGLAASGQLLRQSVYDPPPNFGYNCGSDVPIPQSDSNILLYHTDTSYGYTAGLYDYSAGNKEPRLISPLKAGSRIFRLAGRTFVFDGNHAFYQAGGTGGMIPVQPAFNASILNTPAEGQERLYWENGMAYPILIVGTCAWILDYHDDRLTARLVTEAVPTDAPIYFVQYVDRHNLLFLGTASKGLVIIRKPQVRPVKKERSLLTRNTAYYSQIALPNGTVLTNQGQILGGPPPPPSQLPVKTPFNNYIYLTADSVLWYSYENIIHSYSYKTRRLTSCDAGPGSITTGFIGSAGRLYIANAIGIGVLKDGRIEYGYHFPRPDVNNDVPFSMLELRPGVLAVATCQGLLRYDTRTGALDTLFAIPGTCIRALWKYRDHLFIGTYGKGIYIWKDGVLKAIPADRNNYLLYAHCFIQDRLGYCWISSNKGLFRVRPEELIDAFEKHIPEIGYHYFGKEEGMDMTELNGGCTPCALALNDSTLSFPSMDGLVWVDPAKADVPAPGGELYIDGLTADSTQVNLASLVEPRLPPDTRELNFRLAYPAWAGKENLYIEYKLDPWSPGWQYLDIQNNSTLRFSNLPPGDYNLTIRRLNDGARASYTYISTPFRITAPWYQQAWAWLLCICFLTALVMWIVQTRTAQLQSRQRKLKAEIEEKTRELKQKNLELERTDQIKTRLISIISHDLVTPLKFLHLAGKKLIEKKSELPEALQVETVREMMNTAGELELLSTNILNWIKYRNEDRRLAREHFNVHQLTGHLFRIFNYMARQKGLMLLNQVDEQLTLFQFIEPVRIVLYNLILNGINFTQYGEIRVSSAVTSEGIDLIVADSGVGMTQEQINNIKADHFIISSTNVDNRKGNGLGYLIIKDLLKIIRGSLSIDSGKGRGTTVTIGMPATP